MTKHRLKQITSLLGEHDHSDDPMEQAELAVKMLHGHVGWLIKQAELLNESKESLKYYMEENSELTKQRNERTHLLNAEVARNQRYKQVLEKLNSTIPQKNITECGRKQHWKVNPRTDKD